MYKLHVKIVCVAIYISCNMFLFSFHFQFTLVTQASTEKMYVDVTSKTLECKKCPKGTYSVGVGVHFNNWDKLPTGFESRFSDEHYSGYGYDSEYFTEANGANCSK